jgi:hypothetical protein
LNGSAWTAAKTRTLVQASLIAAAVGKSWTRATAGGLALRLHHAHAIASPHIRASTDSAVARLLTLAAATRRMAEHQREHASLFALRLNAQVKAEIDALRRAARAGKLTLPAWRKLMASATARKGVVNGVETEEGAREPTSGHAKSEPDFAAFQNRDHASSTALMCVEPWRCRLPVVRPDQPGDQLLMGAVRRAPTEARRSS